MQDGKRTEAKGLRLEPSARSSKHDEMLFVSAENQEAKKVSFD